MKTVYDCQQVYSAASSAMINRRKSSALLVGPMQIEEFPTLFHQLTWSHRRLKYLGAYLSVSCKASSHDNWSALEEGISAKGPVTP